MATHAVINNEYLVGQDSSAGFDSRVIDLEKPNASISYQFKWDVGVKGTLTWYACIFEDEWEQYVACESVELVITGEETRRSSIIALPSNWLMVGYLKFSWVPDDEGSSGNINAAIRIAPV